MFTNAIKETLDFQNDSYCQATRENVIHIAYGTDTKFMIGVGVCMTSIILNNPDLNFHFHILTDELKKADRQRLNALKMVYDNIQITVYITNKDFLQTCLTTTYGRKQSIIDLLSLTSCKIKQLKFFT